MRSTFAVATLLGFLCLTPAWAAELSDEQLTAVRDGFAARRDGMLERQVAKPYPPTGVWNRLDYALAAFYRNVELDKANAAVIDAARQSTEALRAGKTARDSNFHWEAPLFFRIHEFFHAGSRFFPGRLSSQAADAIYAVCWKWAQSRSRLAEAQPDRAWHFWGSENHSAMRDCSAWGIATLLARVPAYAQQRYDDGSTPTQQAPAWTQYVKQCLRERVRRGLLVETGSPTYSKYTLQCWYNYYDFAADPELRRLADAALTVYWADWAQEQLGGVRGGGKSRCYQGGASQQGLTDGAAAMAWYYLGVGAKSSAHPGVMCMATSGHRLPLVVMDLALDLSGRGVYEYRSRRPGLRLAAGTKTSAPDDADFAGNVLAPDFGGIVKVTYAAPEFILGANLVPKLPLEAWPGISMQNRWQGAIFAGHPDARIFPECVGERNGKTYNQHWAVQHKGVLIVQKLPPRTYSKQAGDMRVWIASRLKRWEASQWAFVEAPGAWAAVRPAYGGYTWDDATWLHCRDSMAPVILEVARRSDYVTREAFQAAILANRLHVRDDALEYHGLGDAGAFTFYLKSDRLPEVDGQPIDLKPARTFDSPFLQEDWASGTVTISKGSRKLTLDVSH